MSFSPSLSVCASIATARMTQTIRVNSQFVGLADATDEQRRGNISVVIVVSRMAIKYGLS